jgi:sterol 14-demethylase
VVGTDAATPLGPVHLRELALLERMVREAKRTAPILPVVFGKARRDFLCQGYRIPRGWDVHLALSLCNADPAVFASPGDFDPDRYLAPRAEDRRHVHAYVPQGGGPPTGHRCLGVDYATVFGQIFLVELLRGYDVKRLEPGARVNTSLLPQEPSDGQRLRLTPRPL